jgi:hypothetical protein
MAATLSRFTVWHWCLLLADVAIWTYVAQVAL